MTGDFFTTLEKVMMGQIDYLTRPVKTLLPYDIVKDEKTGNITISMAVAGYTPSNLDVSYRDGLLEVKGTGVPYGDNLKVVYQGLSKKNFHVQFPISPIYMVEDVVLENGTLSITFKRNEDAIKKFEIKTK